MLKNLIASASIATAMLMSGCSSYPDSPEDVTKAACEAFKSQDFKALVQYSSDPEKAERALKQFDDAKAKLDALTDEQRAMAEAQMNKIFESVDCTVTSSKETSGGYVVSLKSFPGGKARLKQVDGQWKIID